MAIQINCTHYHIYIFKKYRRVIFKQRKYKFLDCNWKRLVIEHREEITRKQIKLDKFNKNNEL